MSKVIGNNFKEMKQKLDSVGCGFCLAKWTQVTMHLHDGTTHSCHHPAPHKIGLREIKRNHTALHNSSHKKRARKEMLEDKRPKECGYCWKVEDNSNSFSDRIFKSEESWSKPYFNEIKNSQWRDDYLPKYVEVSFSNTCNFKCGYCGPSYSSKWVEEMRKHGEFSTGDNFNSLTTLEKEDTIPYKKTEHNPYVEAFWKWWPDLYQDLHTFRITGGEPLLSKDTFKVLDYIIKTDKPNKNLVLSVNTNMGAPDELMDKFIEKVKIITERNLVKDFQIFTSIDGWGTKSEYIRHGLNYRAFWKNCEKTLTKLTKPSLTFMVTYNALSVFNFDLFIEQLYLLKEKYNSVDRYTSNSVVADISYLRHPSHQSVRILPKVFQENIQSQVNLMHSIQEKGFTEKGDDVFSHMEMEKLQRIYDWCQGDIDEKSLKRNRYDFYQFFTEHDKRRKTNILGVFPEIKQFWEECSKIKKDEVV